MRAWWSARKLPAKIGVVVGALFAVFVVIGVAAPSPNVPTTSVAPPPPAATYATKATATTSVPAEPKCAPGTHRVKLGYCLRNKPTPPPSTSSGPSVRDCGQGISANAATSCAFGVYVEMAYSNASGSAAPDGPFPVQSPVTGRTYSVRCVESSVTVTCRGGTAFVQFSQAVVDHGVTVPSQPSSPTPATTAPSAPAVETVGSSDHSTDAEFCSTRQCIGAFTSEPGTIVQCSDGTYSHSGGISGACSRHGGEA